jgi:hypothetical protein
MSIDERFEAHEARDTKLRNINSRIAKDEKVGWPTIAATVLLAAAAILMIVYMTLDACSSLTE